VFYGNKVQNKFTLVTIFRLQLTFDSQKEKKKSIKSMILRQVELAYSRLIFSDLASK